MALVKCTDCGKEISDSAKACPHCGAPIPVAVGPGEEQCPFCMTVLNAIATVCPGCNAKKGYTQAQGNVYGKGRTIVWGIAIPGVIALILFLIGNAFTIIIGLILVIPVVLSARRLKIGPVWYQSLSVHK